MQQYKKLVQAVIASGTHEHNNRTNEPTLTIPFHSYSVDLAEGFPILTTKEISWKNIVLESLWFLMGDNNINWLRGHGVKFWDPWANPKTGTLDSPYGYFWRNADGVDQVDQVVRLLQTDPSSRRGQITAMIPRNFFSSKLPPCHIGFNVAIQSGRLNLAVFQRSADIGLGVPYNMATYGLIAHIFAHWLGVQPGVLSHAMANPHIYESHLPYLADQQLRKTMKKPRLSRLPPFFKGPEQLEVFREMDTDTILSLFRLDGYEPHPAIKLPVAV